MFHVALLKPYHGSALDKPDQLHKDLKQGNVEEPPLGVINVRSLFGKERKIV